MQQSQGNPNNDSPFIKDCPFCGGTAYLMYGPSRWYIRCGEENCKVRTRRYINIEDVRNAWNKRVKE